MRAMVLSAPGTALQMQERRDPSPGDGEIRVKVSACGVCRTDLHVVDAELPGIKYPVVPGHEIVGRVDLAGSNVTTHRIGDRVGIPWLGFTCGVCRFCKEGMENLCDRPQFTGYTRDGGFATHTIADARYAFPLGEEGDDVAMAPLLCAGLIGWRSLVMAGSAERLGIYGFGAAGHIVAQIARWQGRSVYAFTRSDDIAAQDCPPIGRGVGRGVGPATRNSARCRDHLRPRRTIGAGGAACGTQGWKGGMRRNSYE